MAFTVLMLLDWSGIPSILTFGLDKNLRITLKRLSKILFLMALVSWDFHNFFSSFGRGRKLSFFFLHFEKSWDPLLSGLWRFKLRLFRLFRRSYFDYGAGIIHTDSMITVNEISMVLLFFTFVRLEAKLNDFRNASVPFKPIGPAYTLMEIEVLIWIFEVLFRTLHLNCFIIFQKKTLVFIAEKSKSLIFCWACLSRRRVESSINNFH